MVRRRFLRGNRSGMGHCIATILSRSRRIGYGLLLAALVIHDVQRSLLSQLAKYRDGLLGGCGAM